MGVCLGITNLREFVSREVPCKLFEGIDDHGGYYIETVLRNKKIFLPSNTVGFSLRVLRTLQVGAVFGK